jgi:hypothetical protein
MHEGGFTLAGFTLPGQGWKGLLGTNILDFLVSLLVTKKKRMPNGKFIKPSLFIVHAPDK